MYYFYRYFVDDARGFSGTDKHLGLNIVKLIYSLLLYDLQTSLLMYFTLLVLAVSQLQNNFFFQETY